MHANMHAHAHVHAHAHAHAHAHRHSHARARALTVTDAQGAVQASGGEADGPVAEAPSMQGVAHRPSAIADGAAADVDAGATTSWTMPVRM